MSQGRGPNSERFHDDIDRVSRDVLENKLATPDAILLQALNQVSEISPIHAGGVLLMANAPASVTYSHLHGRETGMIALDKVLKSHRESLADALIQQALLTLPPSSANGNGPDYFTGLPVGRLGDRRVGLGLLSDRELTDRERGQLLLLGRLIGQSAENARVRQQMIDEERRRAVNLIGLIAHELRTPLTGLRGNIQLALMASQSGKFDRIPARLETAIKGVDSMTSLVQSLLDVSRLERGTYHLERVPADFGETIQMAVDNAPAEVRSELDRVVLSRDSTNAVPHDRQAFERVGEYLLVTVLHYSSSDSAIALDVVDAGDVQRLDLRYDGQPLPEQEQRALIAPLYGERDRSDDRRGVSLPLNLAFCRGVVVGHGGHIEVSGPAGTGTHTISLRIPKSGSPQV